MINHQSDKPEKFEPKDSERKNIEHPEDDNKAVRKPEDEEYKEEDADFVPPPAESKEISEQPVQPVKDAPKDI